MLGLSWIELAFCALLALVIIGPKDLPEFARLIGRFAGGLRRLYEEAQGGLTQLEREIANAQPKQSRETWIDYLPPDVKALRDTIKPHSDDAATAEQYRQVQQAMTKARADFVAARQHAGAAPGGETGERGA